MRGDDRRRGTGGWDDPRQSSAAELEKKNSLGAQNDKSNWEPEEERRWLWQRKDALRFRERAEALHRAAVRAPLEFRVDGGTDTKARETNVPGMGAPRHIVSGTHLTDAATKETEETGPGRIRIAAPGMRRPTAMAVREDGGVEQRPLKEEGGPDRVGQFPAQGAHEKACRTEREPRTERKATNTSDRKIRRQVA